MSIPPSSLPIVITFVFIRPELIFAAVIESIIASLINASSTVTLSAVILNAKILSLVKFPLTSVFISAKSAFNTSISAFVAFKS